MPEGDSIDVVARVCGIGLLILLLFGRWRDARDLAGLERRIAAIENKPAAVEKPRYSSGCVPSPEFYETIRKNQERSR